jgi:putative DNA primase/helicase
MSATIQAALDYARRGWPVFPCNWRPGPDHKKPLIQDWDEVASRDLVQIDAWWTRWPKALIGV